MSQEYLSLDYLASAAMIVTGLVLAIGIRRRCGALWAPVFLLFALFADPHLYYAQICIRSALHQLDFSPDIARSGSWSATWAIVPRLIAVFCAYGIWREVRRLSLKLRAPDLALQRA